jgi:RNA polymerase sigma-70 factor (family 1)
MTMDKESLVFPRLLDPKQICAFELLFKKYYKPLVVQAFVILGDSMEAEDLVQGLFIDLWDKNYGDIVHTSIRSYLYRAVKNRSLNVIERRNTEQKRSERYKLTLTESIFNQEIEQDEMKLEIDRIMSSLPQQRLQTFNLVYLEDKKYKEAASELGISINTVKTHLKLAVKYLRVKFVELK